MAVTCFFCNQDVTYDAKNQLQNLYMCKRCGPIQINNHELSIAILAGRFPEYEKSAISITLRNEWERCNYAKPTWLVTFSDLERIVKQFKPFDPLEKMDNILININKRAKFVGAEVEVSFDFDYPYYYCTNKNEMIYLFKMVLGEKLISGDGSKGYIITTKGYQRLREIQRPNQESNQCFVAMWFADEMKAPYDNAIKPAIEYLEEGQTEPKFKAVKIDNVEHLNDINDELIAQIRRSRFMVCDLTGYRGGVYFEAGFAYGLGLPVIYTCRKDWSKPETLKDAEGKEVKELFGSNQIPIKIQKEGVHFDLNHRNRIEWDPDPEGLKVFRKRLEDRIKANIY